MAEVEGPSRPTRNVRDAATNEPGAGGEEVAGSEWKVVSISNYVKSGRCNQLIKKHNNTQAPVTVL